MLCSMRYFCCPTSRPFGFCSSVEKEGVRGFEVFLRFPGGKVSLWTGSVLCSPQCRIQNDVLLRMVKFSGSTRTTSAGLYAGSLKQQLS